MILSAYEFASSRSKIELSIWFDKQYDNDFWLVFLYDDEPERQKAWAIVNEFGKKEDWYMENYDMPIIEVQRQLAPINQERMQHIKIRREKRAKEIPDTPKIEGTREANVSEANSLQRKRKWWQFLSSP